jgi:hypothetical protein
LNSRRPPEPDAAWSARRKSRCRFSQVARVFQGLWSQWRFNRTATGSSAHIRR